MKTNHRSPLNLASLFLLLLLAPAAAPAATLRLEVPDWPGQGYTLRGDGFDPNGWVWIDVNDGSDGSQPVHGPDAFLPDAQGSFTRSRADAFACGHPFQAVAFVNDGVAALSPVVTPSCTRPVTALSLAVPDAPSTGFTVTGAAFDPAGWVWITVHDTTTGAQLVDGPDAFQPAADGGFARSGADALPCGHGLLAKAWVGNEVATVSATVTPACPPAGPVLALSVPDAPGTGFSVSGRGFDTRSWVWITVHDTTTGGQLVDGPDAFQPAADGTFSRAGATALPCGHTLLAKAWVDDQIGATSVPATPRCAAPPEPPAFEAVPADQAASVAVRGAYAFLANAPGRAASRLVIGQALRGWDYDQPVAQPVTALTDAGLPAPKLLELDLTDFGVTAEHDRQMLDLLADHASRGGLVGLSFHADNPFTGGSVYDRDGVDLSQLANPANPQSAAAIRWKSSLDRAADVIERLRDAGAVVLFRPLHESNGSWFWWGQADVAGFRAAWRGMFRYLTGTRGLHNLLFVYSANRNLGGDLSDPTRLFPGSDVVDVVGLDIYDDDLSDAEAGQPGYAAMLAYGKPFAISEYGASNWPADHDGAVFLSNAKVMETIRQRYPATVLATAWYSQGGNDWQISDKPDPAALLLDPWAVTR